MSDIEPSSEINIAIYNCAVKHRQSYMSDTLSDILINNVIHLVKPPILEIGAGTGTFASVLRKSFYEVEAIDTVPAGAGVKKGDSNSLDYRKNYFNTVFAIGMLEHLSDDDLELTLKEVNRVMQHDGSFIFYVPDNENLEESMVNCPQCHAEFHRHGHLQVFNLERIQLLFRQYGFALVWYRLENWSNLKKYPIVYRVYRLLEKIKKMDYFEKCFLCVARKIR